MKIKYGERRDFWGYLTPLRHLEQTFRAVGMKIDIELSLFSDGAKNLCIDKGSDIHVVSLNDSTPEQAIKNAACFLASDCYSLRCSKSPQFKKEKKNG